MHTDESVVGGRRSVSVDWLAGLLLFTAAAAIVVWQNSRLAVLWDLSYILENANRIALGQVPYRDFPFPYAPLTFLIQAALIKLGGRVFWHTVVYCAVLNGLAIVLTWRILVNLLRDMGKQVRWLAILLTLPLIPLGIYSIFPHPFYDPDCTFAILVAIYLWQRAGQSVRSARLWSLFAGAALVVPLFVKQNTGLPFVGSAALALALLIAIELIRRRPVGQYLAMIAGAATAVVVAFSLLSFTAGLRNYWHWTIQFAASRRTPARAEMLEIYSGKTLLLWLGLFLSGAVVLRLSHRGKNHLLRLLSALLLAVPFVWPAIYLWRDNDTSEQAERLVNTWPLLIIVSFIVAIITIKRRRGLALVLPFIIIATIQGAFMSQQLWGSTYAIWPLFMILLGMTIAGLRHLCFAAAPGRQFGPAPPPRPDEEYFSWQLPLTALIVLSLLLAGSFYLRSHERLDYANLDEGELQRSSLPQLKGMSTRGDWLPNFAELVRYTDEHVPREEGILVLPGEDLFYFTTGRTPRFPVLMFDHTVNPYSAEEIVRLARERDIRWLIVKQDLQDEDEGVEKQRDEIAGALDEDFEQVESLGNYDIYHRRDPNKKDEDNDDDSDPTGAQPSRLRR